MKMIYLLMKSGLKGLMRVRSSKIWKRLQSRWSKIQSSRTFLRPPRRTELNSFKTAIQTSAVQARVKRSARMLSTFQSSENLPFWLKAQRVQAKPDVMLAKAALKLGPIRGQDQLIIVGWGTTTIRNQATLATLFWKQIEIWNWLSSQCQRNARIRTQWSRCTHSVIKLKSQRSNSN